jgi:hypothetical protein
MTLLQDLSRPATMHSLMKLGTYSHTDPPRHCFYLTLDWNTSRRSLQPLFLQLPLLSAISHGHQQCRNLRRNLFGHFLLLATSLHSLVAKQPYPNLSLLQLDLSLLGLCTHMPHPWLTAHGNTALDLNSAQNLANLYLMPVQIFTTTALDIVLEFLIDKSDMATVFMPPSPYFESFKEILDLRKFDITKHRTVNLCLAHQTGCLFLKGMAPNTKGAKIPCWHTRIKDAWLIKIGNKLVCTINDAQRAFHTLLTNGATTVTLLFLHSKIQPTISHDGLPIVSGIPFNQHVHDQMNH